MANGHIDLSTPKQISDPRIAWASAVAADETTLGLQDWMAQADLMQTV